MLFLGVTKRAKVSVAEPSSLAREDMGAGFDRNFKAYLYWPLAAIMIALSMASYLAGMYFAS